jgi:hypothetical protein
MFDVALEQDIGDIEQRGWKAHLELSNIGSFPNSLVGARDNVEFSLALVGTIGMSSNRWWVGGETCANWNSWSQLEQRKVTLRAFFQCIRLS